ncbi:MAG: DUF167 family protein [Planctomycetota bacterium]|jgi:uncharacterized protein (TIGR00251 family)|nr:DUF167 family protein [Planctomycetota bacterium]
MNLEGLLIGVWEGGSTLPLKVRAASRRQGIVGVQDGRLRVEVTVAPEKGKANQAVIRLLGAKIGVKGSDIMILSGENNPRKNLGVRGLGPDELRRRLEEL